MSVVGGNSIGVTPIASQRFYYKWITRTIRWLKGVIRLNPGV